MYDTLFEKQNSARPGRETQLMSYVYRGGLQKKASTIDPLIVNKIRKNQIPVERLMTYAVRSTVCQPWKKTLMFTVDSQRGTTRRMCSKRLVLIGSAKKMKETVMV